MSDATAPLRLDVNGVDVAYRRRGTGEPLVYLHGGGLTRRWLPLHDALAERFDAIAPEHPGFGDTARPAWYRSLDDMALHYADFLSALGVDAAHVVGHSLGGRIAGSFAAIFPERVRTLTLIAPAPLATVTPEEEVGLPELPEDFDFDEILFSGNQAAYPEYRDDDDEGLVVAPDAGDRFADPAGWDIDGAPSLYRRLARVRCPAQVLVPEEDRLIPHPCFDAWAHRLGDVPVVTVPGGEYPTSHMLVVQEPRAIAELVRGLALAGERTEMSIPGQQAPERAERGPRK